MAGSSFFTTYNVRHVLVWFLRKGHNSVMEYLIVSIFTLRSSSVWRWKSDLVWIFLSFFLFQLGAPSTVRESLKCQVTIMNLINWTRFMVTFSSLLNSTCGIHFASPWLTPLDAFIEKQSCCWTAAVTNSARVRTLNAECFCPNF